MNEIIGKKALVIFDLDNTIVKLSVDWSSCRKELRNYLKNNHDLNLPHGMRVDQMEFKASQLLDDAKIADMLSKIRAKYEQRDLSKSKINFAAVKLVRMLHDKKIKLAILSNNLHNTIEKFLNIIDLDVFELIVGIDDSMKPKPDTKGMNMILENYNLPKQKILYIGDNEEIDGKVAMDSGIDYLDVSEIKL